MINCQQTIGIVSGGFDIIHCGHLAYIEAARKFIGPLGQLIAIVNDDSYIANKGGCVVFPLRERMEMVAALKWVNMVVPCYSDDVSRVLEDIYKQREADRGDIQRGGYRKIHPIYFFNSGDRDTTNWNPKEVEVCRQYNIEQIYIDLPKVNSSSVIKERLKSLGQDTNRVDQL